MLKNITQQSIKWFKTELAPILIFGSLFLLSLAFIIAMLYFASLFTTQLFKSEIVNKYEKTKSTIQYAVIIILMSYLTISNGHFTLLAIAYICSIIGAITGHVLPNHIDE